LVNAAALPIRALPGLPTLETDQSFSKATGGGAVPPPAAGESRSRSWAGSTFIVVT
jgi:hypothetical protein